MSPAYEARALLSPAPIPASQLFMRPLRAKTLERVAELIERAERGPQELFARCLFELLVADQDPNNLTRARLFRDLQIALSTDPIKARDCTESSLYCLFRAIVLTLQYVSIERYPSTVLHLPSNGAMHLPSVRGGYVTIKISQCLTLHMGRSGIQIHCDGDCIGTLNGSTWDFSSKAKKIAPHKSAAAICMEYSPPWPDAQLLNLETAQALWGKCVELLENVWHDAFVDIEWLCARIIPLALAEKGAWRSSSSSGEPFLIFATLSQLSLRESCEGVLHESMHLRFHLIESIAPIIKDGQNQAKYFHAWRKEPRPPRAVFLAAHAFFNIWRFYCKHLASKYGAEIPLESECETVKRKVQAALSTLLSSGSLTLLGEILACEMVTDLRNDCA